MDELGQKIVEFICENYNNGIIFGNIDYLSFQFVLKTDTNATKNAIYSKIWNLLDSKYLQLNNQRLLVPGKELEKNKNE